MRYGNVFFFPFFVVSDDAIKEFLGDNIPSGNNWRSQITVKMINAALSKFTSRTSSPEELRKYIDARKIYNALIKDYYNAPLFRYFRQRVYSNEQRTEMKWIQEFSDKFGRPEDIVVVIGDWCRNGVASFRGRHARPASYSRIIQRLRNAGFAVLLVDEAYTSKRCSNCQSSTATCSGDSILGHIIHTAPNRFNRLQSHGRVVCDTCLTLFNRDVNASRNIYNLAMDILNCGERPLYLPPKPTRK